MEEGRSSSDSGRDSPTDDRVRIDLQGRASSATEDSTDEQSRSVHERSPQAEAASLARKLSPIGAEAAPEDDVTVQVYDVRTSPVEGAVGGVPRFVEPGKVHIPRLDLGGSDDEGAVDLGLPYSDGEFTSGRTNTGRNQDQNDPDTPISSVASELSSRAVQTAVRELEAEHQVREAIEAVSSEFVSGETGYFNHSLVESDEEDTEDKRPSVYHICEPWSDHDNVGDAWSTCSSKEITPRDPDSRGSTLVGTGEFSDIKTIVANIEERDRQAKMKMAAIAAGSSERKIRDSPIESIEVRLSSPLDHPYLRRATDLASPSSRLERLSPSVDRSVRYSPSTLAREERKSPSGGAEAYPLLDNRRSPYTDRFERLSPVSAEHRSPSSGQSSPSPNRVGRSPLPSADRSPLPSADRSPSYMTGAARNERTSPSQSEKSPSFIRSALLSPSGENSRTSPRNDRPVKTQNQDHSPTRTLTTRSPMNYGLDRRVEQEYALPPWKTSEDENSESIVSRSTYRPLPTGESRREEETLTEPEISQRESIRTDDFNELHQRTESEMSDFESDLTVQELLRRCERELMDSPAGSGSVVSDEVSESEIDDNDEQLARRVRMLLENAAREPHDEVKMLDDSLARRIRALLDDCSSTSLAANIELEPSPRASPRSIRELIHSISINRSADSDVHRELEDIEENWKHDNRKSPGSRAESSASAATIQSKNSDDFSKKRLAWDYGADLSEGNLPQFVASVDPQDETRARLERARSASPPRTLKDSLTFPTKSTSLLSVNKSSSMLSTLDEGKLFLAQRVMSLLQKDSPQEQAYSILREAEEQERRLATKSIERDAEIRSREGSTRDLTGSGRLGSTASSSHTNVGRFELYSDRKSPEGYRDHRDEHKTDDKDPRENLEARKSLSTTLLDRSTVEKRESEESFRGDETAVSARASRSLISDYSPVSNKPYLASNTAQHFLSNQLKRANERRFTPGSPQRERLEEQIQGKTRPSILRGFMDRNETDHEASREISRIQAHVENPRVDLVTLRQAVQPRDFGSSIETSQGETTMESTHTGSDDARAPSFPSYVYGTRADDSPAHKVGVYERDVGDHGFLEQDETSNRGELRDETVATTDRSVSSTVSRKRAWVEEQIEDIETSMSAVLDYSRMTADELIRATAEPRREPRRSLQILQEILEKESDSEAVDSGDAWKMYQAKRAGTQGSENILRLLKSLTQGRYAEVPPEGQVTSRSTLSAFSSIKTEGSVKFPPGSDHRADMTSPSALMTSPPGRSAGDHVPSLDIQTPRSGDSSRDTDEELRYRMATLLEQADSLTSIPEMERSVDEDRIKKSLPPYDDPKLASIHMKIRLQREKYLQGRRREQKRKEKIQILQRILEAKSGGNDVSSDCSSLQTSETTTTVNSSDWSVSTGERTRCGHVCQHGSDESSYCPCKDGITPRGEKVVPKFREEITPRNEKIVPERDTRGIRKDVYEKHKRILRESLDSEKHREVRTEVSATLVSEGTQTSPALGRAVQKKRSKRSKSDRKEERNITDSSNVENTPPSRKSRQEDSRSKKKPTPRTGHGGLCWFVPLEDPSRRPEFTRALKPMPRRYVHNLPKDEIVSGTEFCLDRNDENGNKISLQDAFAMFNQRFISRSRQREKRVRLIGQQKRMEILHSKQREALFSLRKKVVPNARAHPLSDQWYRPGKRYFTKDEMKGLTEKVYRQLPEVLEKAELKKREAEYRNNRLRAEIYKRKQLSRALCRF